MEKIGIPKNYKQILKAQIGNILGALTFALSVIIINSFMIFMNDKIPLRSKVSSAFTMGYPVLVTFIADTTFMNIVKKVLSIIQKRAIDWKNKYSLSGQTNFESMYFMNLSVSTSRVQTAFVNQSCSKKDQPIISLTPLVLTKIYIFI